MVVRVQPPRDDLFQRSEVAGERSHDRLDPAERQHGRAVLLQHQQLGLEDVDFGLEPALDLVAPLAVGGGEQRRGRGDDAFRRARQLERRDCRRNAGIDHVEPLAHLPESVDANGGGQDREGRDAEEGEQQTRAHAEIP